MFKLSWLHPLTLQLRKHAWRQSVLMLRIFRHPCKGYSESGRSWSCTLMAGTAANAAVHSASAARKAADQCQQHTACPADLQQKVEAGDAERLQCSSQLHRGRS